MSRLNLAINNIHVKTCSPMLWTVVSLRISAREWLSFCEHDPVVGNDPFRSLHPTEAILDL